MMKRLVNKRILFILLFLSTMLPPVMADLRKDPMDFFLILDISAIKSHRQEAIEWVCDAIIDKMVQEGDRLTVWSTLDERGLVFNDTISATLRESLKKQVRNLQNSGDVGNLSKALKDAERKVTALPAKHLSYTLLVSGVGYNPNSAPDGVADLLRYGKTMDFSGWKAMVVGLGINTRVHDAATSYINSKK